MDDKALEERFKLEVRMLIAEVSRRTSVDVICVTSSEEMRVWLQNHGDEIFKKLRIIANSFRPEDGGDGAAERVVHTRDELLLDVPVLVYLRSAMRQEKLALMRKLRSVYVTTESLGLLE